MKNCLKCKIAYSDLWCKCLKCHAELAQPEKGFFGFRKKPYKALEKTGYIIEQLIKQANSLVVFADMDSEVLLCNDAIEDFTGYKKEEVFKHGWLDLLYKNQQARKEMFKAVMKSCSISIKSKTYEAAIIKKDGSECMLSWRLAAILDDKNKKLGILCVAQDVTERKITEGDIDIHGQRLKDILSSIREYALMTTNLEGKITYYGLGAREVFGWPADKVYLEDISLIYPDRNKSEVIREISGRIEKESRFEGELNLVRKDGVEFPAIVTITPLLNSREQVNGYIYIGRNITEKKKIEQQMIRSEKLAAVGQLASGVAHEINNPLLVIMGRMDLLDEDNAKLPKDVAKALEIIKTQSQRIRTISDRLLSYSKDIKPDIKSLDLNKLIATISPLLSYYPEFKKIKWIENLQPDLPLIKGDFNQIQEVFINLGLNACQSMPNGGEITISTKRAQNENFVEAQVKDTGEGMDDSQLKSLFDPFFTTKDGGTGLGLSICRNIIDQHKAKIEVDSQKGKGTTFIIKLPLAK